MKVIIAAALLLIAVAAHADCPVEIPGENRVRIVQCTDDSYSLQWLSVDSLHWYQSGTCGLSLQEARIRKASMIIWEKTIDSIECPPPRPGVKTPLVIVE